MSVIQGFGSRPAIAAWLTGIDLVFVKASLETREVLLEVGLDTQYLLARIKDPQQKLEAQARARTPLRSKPRRRAE